MGILSGNDCVINFIQRSLDINKEEYKIIPNNLMPTEFYYISFQGRNGCYVDINDSTFREMMQLAKKSVDAFITKYKDTHAFSQPDIFFKPDLNNFTVIIGTMQNDWERDMRAYF